MTRLHLVHAIGDVWDLRDGRRVVAQGSRAAMLSEAAELLGGPLQQTQDDADVLLTRQVASHGAHADDDALRAEIARLRGGR